jgi:hypothetical protein
VTAHVLVRVAGILGGLCWVVRTFLESAGGPTAAIDALRYGGLALLVMALLGIGAELVSGLVALRVVVALCLVALAWAVTSFLHHQYTDRYVDAVLGALMVVYCSAGILLRRRHAGDDQGHRPHRSPGAHAA